ncbi:efflux RND transporter periplasmic adaptor subunit [Ravibacter arvi]|uniref:Efflux RND transporter periplasmic adaptor subunit n=1 Tax=Ravibacter arvi TaxID=2051041 RepID=A0ABP8M9U4_9BACT
MKRSINSLLAFLLIAFATACTSENKEGQPVQESHEGHSHEGHAHKEGETHNHDVHKEHDEFTVEMSERQFQTGGIQVGTTASKGLSGSLLVNGYIDTPPYNLVTVSAILGGVIRSTRIIEGTPVKRGQVLATIENPEFIQIQQDYLDTKSRLEYAELELRRQDELQKEQINARKNYESARAEFGSLRARLAGLEQRLAAIGLSPGQVANGIQRILPIYSPISGTVTTVSVNLGKQVGPSDEIFEIVNPDHLHAELRVYESDIHKIKKGQTVRFSLVSNPKKEMLAKVHLINTKIDEDRTVRVHCHLSKVYPDLMPDQYVKAFIETGTETLQSVPDEALVAFDNKDYVFVFKGKEESEDHQEKSVFRMIEVIRGLSANGFTAITPANQADSLDQIVTKGAYTLLSLLKNTESDHGHAH